MPAISSELVSDFLAECPRRPLSELAACSWNTNGPGTTAAADPTAQSSAVTCQPHKRPAAQKPRLTIIQFASDRNELHETHVHRVQSVACAYGWEHDGRRALSAAKRPPLRLPREQPPGQNPT